jgi:hypothetical protein
MKVLTDAQAEGDVVGVNAPGAGTTMLMESPSSKVEPVSS